MAAKFTSANPANIGIITGLSGVTIVDVDDPTLFASMIERCGATPLTTRTPRGGVHLWYRASGEREVTGLDGLKVDVKADKGIIIVPPSFRPNTGQPYEFIEGDWADLASLPRATAGSLPLKGSTPAAGRLQRESSRIGEGTRNHTLFRDCLRQARRCDTYDDLLDVARTHNEDATPPLADAEVQKIVGSVWFGYETQGRNWTGGEPRLTLTMTELAAFEEHRHGPEGLMLHLHLKACHSARKGSFAVSAKGMEREQAIPHWRRRGYENARDACLDVGSLEQIHKGGARKGDADQFVLGKIKGAKSNPNIIKHRSPGDRADLESKKRSGTAA